MKNYIVIASVCFCLLNSSCKKTSEVIHDTGTLIDYTGRLDGCHFMIVSDNGKRFEITKIPSGFVFIDNKRVSFNYIFSHGASICMAGDMIEIISIEYI